MPNIQAIRERLAELHTQLKASYEGRADVSPSAIRYASAQLESLLEAPEETAEETIALAGGDWTIRRTGEHVTIIDAAGQVRHRSSGIQTAVHLAMQLAQCGAPEYVDQWPESAKQLAEAREAARWLLPIVGRHDMQAFATAVREHPWLAESEAAK